MPGVYRQPVTLTRAISSRCPSVFKGEALNSPTSIVNPAMDVEYVSHVIRPVSAICAVAREDAHCATEPVNVSVKEKQIAPYVKGLTIVPVANGRRNVYIATDLENVEIAVEQVNVVSVVALERRSSSARRPCQKYEPMSLMPCFELSKNG